MKDTIHETMCAKYSHNTWGVNTCLIQQSVQFLAQMSTIQAFKSLTLNPQLKKSVGCELRSYTLFMGPK